jgi:3-isopropylmalate/(R)-2-methylmalate dehydratase small subunit
VLSEQEVDQLFNQVKAFPGYQLRIDLPAQTLSTINGDAVYRFEIDTFRKHCLINGLDDIGLTLQHADKIRSFEERHLVTFPWLTNTIT